MKFWNWQREYNTKQKSKEVRQRNVFNSCVRKRNDAYNENTSCATLTFPYYVCIFNQKSVVHVLQKFVTSTECVRNLILGYPTLIHKIFETFFGEIHRVNPEILRYPRIPGSPLMTSLQKLMYSLFWKYWIQNFLHCVYSNRNI